MVYNYAFIRIVGGKINVCIEDNTIILPQIYVENDNEEHTLLFNMIDKDCIQLPFIKIENTKNFFYVILKKNIKIKPKCQFINIVDIKNGDFKVSELYDFGIKFYINRLPNEFKETKDILNLLNSNNIYFNIDNENKVNLILKSLSYFQQANKNQRPDIICNNSNDKICIGIEMFDFDSTKKTKAGMSGFIDRKKFDTDYNSFLVNAVPSQINEFNVDQESKIVHYLKNFRDIFKKHTANIPDYIEKLQDINTNYMLGFFISDKTIGGIICKDKDGYDLPYIFNYKIFWSLFCEEDELDFIIFTSSNSNEYYFIFKEDYKCFKDSDLKDEKSGSYIKLSSIVYGGKII